MLRRIFEFEVVLVVIIIVVLFELLPPATITTTDTVVKVSTPATTKVIQVTHHYLK